MPRPSRGTLQDLRPDIAAQLVDKSLGANLAVGSSKSVEWECEKGHRWFATVYNRTNPKHPSGCPYCSSKKLLSGFNDLATTDPEIAKMCANPEDAYEVMRSSNKKILWKCEHGHIWEAPVSRVANMRGGCPVCSGRIPEVGVNDLATTHPEIAAQLEDLSLATKLKARSNRKVRWICPNNPNHIWEASPDARTHKHTGCPYCSGRVAEVGVNDLATTHPQLAAELLDPADAYKYSAGSTQVVKWVCKNHPDHIYEATIYNRTGNGIGCPICAGKQVKVGFNDLATTRPDLVERLVDPSLAKFLTQGSGQIVEWKCEKDPTHTWMSSVHNEARKTTSHCPICGHVHRSYEEQELEKVVRLLLPEDEDIRISDRSVLGSNLELDLYIPNRKVAIEFNGVYWHSEATDYSPRQHLLKNERCVLKGINLLQIWEDDWWDRKDICIRAIAAKLGVINNLPKVLPDANPKIFERIGARKTKATTLTTKEIVKFLNDNHIQGFTSGKYYFGLKDSDGDIRAAMVLRSPSHSIPSGRAEGEWEISRYATCGTVQGGFSKLMKFAEEFLKENDEYLFSWVSFSANNISDGGMYEKTGFIKLDTVAPDYDYVGEYTKWHRSAKENFRKAKFKKKEDLIYKDGWSEHEAALANKLYRIYDAGKIKWVKLVE